MSAETSTIILATDLYAQWIILDAPGVEYGTFESNCCWDHGFVEETLPKEPGIYRCECEINTVWSGAPWQGDWDMEVRVISYEAITVFPKVEMPS